MFANSAINIKKFVLPATVSNINNLFEDCINLLQTPSNMFDNNPKNIVSYDYIFNNCTSLNTIDKTFIYLSSITSSINTFANTQITIIPDTLILPDSLSNISYCFYRATKLISISKNFQFPSGLTNLSYCFANCNLLTEIPETIWPEKTFNIETTINIQGAFENCSNASGIVPQYKLWKGEIYWNPLSETEPLAPMAFFGCIKLNNYNIIPKHWGGLGEDYNSFDIEIETTENDEFFALPIHRTYDTYNYESGERLTKIANYNFIIDWGDGSEPTSVNVSGNDTSLWNMTEGTYFNYPKNFPTETNKNSIPNISGISHTYKNIGKYVISILSQNGNINNNFQCDTLYVHINDTYTWRNLISIYSLGDLKWKSFQNSFCNAKKLTTLPNQNLIQNKNEFSSENSEDLIFNISYMFYNCISISNIPINFTLHKNLIDMSYMFYNCFKACISSNGFKTGIFPSNGFYNSSTKINVTSMFENCYEMTGQVKSRILWFSPFNAWESTNCFSSCNTLSNWNYIPISWGGGGQEDPFIFEIKLPNNSNNIWQVTLPLYSQSENFYEKGVFYTPNYIYNFRIDWGDGSKIDQIKDWQAEEKTHIYTSYGTNNSGIFTIKIYGLFEGWNTFTVPPSVGDCEQFKNLIYKIKNWGKVEYSFLTQFLLGCVNLIEIPNTVLPIPLANQDLETGKNVRYSWRDMFYNCINLQIPDKCTLPLSEDLIDFERVSSVEIDEMFLQVNMNSIPKMFQAPNDIISQVKKLALKYNFTFSYSNIFKSLSNDFSIDLAKQYCASIDDYSRMVGIELRAAKIRYKFDETNETELPHENQISALVQEITPGSPSSYFIYPRYAGDDLIYNDIFLKHPNAYIGSSGIWLMLHASQYITRFPDNEFKIIFEDLSQSELKEYDYKKFITTYNNIYSRNVLCGK